MASAGMFAPIANTAALSTDCRLYLALALCVSPSMAEMMLTGIKIPKAALIVAAAAGTAGAYYMLRSRL